LRTDVSGTLSATLPSGDYLLESVHPVLYNGRSYTWSKRINLDATKPTRLTLTDSDATISGTAPSTPSESLDEGALYRKFHTGVVTVENDAGHGSGFVVDSRGLILTNQHVTFGTHFVAVRFAPGKRFPAAIVAEDKDADVAVICFNPSAYSDFTVIPLASPASGPIATIGNKVVAIGSPLDQETILTSGIVSKVEPGVLISDVNINPGNSGGPLLDEKGEAIGITTFINQVTSNGPGISGIVSIDKALPILEKARKEFDSSKLPPATNLPDMPPPIPDSVMDEAAKTKRLPEEIKAPHNFLTTISTPFEDAYERAEAQRKLTEDLQRRAKKRSRSGAPPDEVSEPRRFYDRYVGANDAVVRIWVDPVPREKSSSLWMRALVNVNLPQHMEFRDDFWDMQLLRGTQVIEPVRRNRLSFTIVHADWVAYMKDKSYAGYYLYDPAAFAPGETLTLRVHKAFDLDHWMTVPIDPKLQARIWEEFAPYRAAIAPAESAATSTDSARQTGPSQGPERP